MGWPGNVTNGGAEGKGVGLDGVGTGGQIGLVNGHNLLRAVQIGLLAALNFHSGICGMKTQVICAAAVAVGAADIESPAHCVRAGDLF